MAVKPHPHEKAKKIWVFFMFVQLRNYFILIISDNTSEKRTTRASFAYTTLETLDDVTYVLQAIILLNVYDSSDSVG